MVEEYTFIAEEAQKNWGVSEKSSQTLAKLFQDKYDLLAHNCFDMLAGYVRYSWRAAKSLRLIKDDDSSCDVQIPEEIILESERALQMKS